MLVYSESEFCFIVNIKMSRNILVVVFSVLAKTVYTKCFRHISKTVAKVTISFTVSV